MKKKTGFLLCFIMTLMMSLTAFAESRNESDNNENLSTADIFLSVIEYEKQIEKEQPAIQAYEQIIEGLQIVLPSDAKFPNYPDSFGGAYYKDEHLYVCLTDDLPGTKSVYMNLVSNPDILRFELVQNSYNDLYNLSLQIAENMDEDISSVSVNIYENAVEIGVPADNGKFEQTKNKIGKKLKFKQSENIIFVREEKSCPSATELIGGQNISWEKAGESYNGTIGIGGTWNGKPAVLTAGHCVVTGAKYRHLSKNGKVFGTGAYRRYSNAQFYDYGIITLDTEAGLDFVTTNKVKNNSNFTTITDVPAIPILLGATVCKYGQKKGFAVGTVDKVNSIAEYTGMTLKGMYRATFTSGTGASGDSGSPVYSGHKIYGIYSGDDSKSNSGSATHFWFTPIQGVDDFVVRVS